MKQEYLRQIFEAYSDMLYRIAFTHMKNHSEADDVVQEVFIRLIRNQPMLTSEEHEKAWLIRTAINLCKDYEKAAWNTKTISMESVPEAEKQYFKLPFLETDETLWAVMQLSEKYRNAVYLFYYEDYSIKEIGVILGEQENTIKTRLRRAREKLKKILQNETF